MNRDIKKFLIKFSVFTLGVIVVVTALCVAAHWVISQANFNIPQEKNILIIGDSHTECGIDDQIFSRAINLSLGGTGYLYEFAVLRKMVEANPQIDTVLLSFHPEALSQRSNNGLYGLERTGFKLPIYVNLMSQQEIKKLNAPLSEVVTAYISSVKYAATLLLKNFDYRALKLGGYLSLDRHKLEQDIKIYEEMTPDKDAFNQQTLQWDVLVRMAQFCNERNIALILIDTPKHKIERTIHRPIFYEQINGRLPKGVTYLDYSDFALADSCYGDVMHLNFYGAQAFSKYLQDSSLCGNR